MKLRLVVVQCMEDPTSSFGEKNQSIYLNAMTKLEAEPKMNVLLFEK